MTVSYFASSYTHYEATDGTGRLNKKHPLLRNGIWKVEATGTMLGCEDRDNELRRLPGMIIGGHSI